MVSLYIYIYTYIYIYLYISIYIYIYIYIYISLSLFKSTIPSITRSFRSLHGEPRQVPRHRLAAHPAAGRLRRAGGWKQRRRSAAPHASNGGLRFEALVGWFLRTWRCGDLEVIVGNIR